GADVSTPPSAVPPLSPSTSVIVAEPFASGAAVNVSVPSGATAGCTENSAALSLPVTENDRAWPASFAGPALIAVAQFASVTAPASSELATSSPGVKLGSSLTGVIASVKSSLAENSPSPTSSVIVVEPNRSAAGVIVAVHAGAVPPSTMFATGTTVVSD